MEGLFPEDLDGANGLGAGLAGDLLAGLEMDAVLADVLGGKKIGGLVVKLTDLAEAGEIGLFRARTNGQQLEVVGEGF